MSDIGMEDFELGVLHTAARLFGSGASEFLLESGVEVERLIPIVLEHRHLLAVVDFI